MEAHRVVIIGGGFGGMYAGRALRGTNTEVTLVDRRNFHLFQPLLYQVATAGLSPGEITSPLRAVFKRHKNVKVLLAEAMGFDVEGRRVILSDGELPYDTLIVAAGSRHSYFGNDEWEPYAPGLKTIEEALEIRRRIFTAFELAEREPDPVKRCQLLTFVVIGGGPTGVELAGALGEITRQTLKGDFRSINPADSEVLLIEGTDRVLPPYPPELSAKAERALERLGVTVHTELRVTGVSEDGVTVSGNGKTSFIPASTVLWSAGVQASPLAKMLGAATGAEVDRAGRVKVNADLTLPEHPEIFVVGDMALALGANGKPLPGVAPVAMQQGKYVAEVIAARLNGERTHEPFRYFDKGSMATIGPAAAVAQVGPFKFNGYMAWLAWLFIHLLYIAEFDNRLLILVQWAWNYVTRNRGARLITGSFGNIPTPPKKGESIALAGGDGYVASEQPAVEGAPDLRK